MKLELAKKVFAGNARALFRARKIRAELAFQKSVNALDLLFLAKLNAVAEDFGAAAAVLARRVITALDGALVFETTIALQEELHSLAAAKPANGVGVTSHCSSWCSHPLHHGALRGRRLLLAVRNCHRCNTHRTQSFLDSPTLRRPATIVRNRRHVFDRFDVETTGCECTDGRLASCSRTFDLHVDRTNAMLLCKLRCILRSNLRRERSAFARAFEADASGARPRHDVPHRIADGDDGVVERRRNRSDAVWNVLALFALAGGATSACWCCRSGCFTCICHPRSLSSRTAKTAKDPSIPYGSLGVFAPQNDKTISSL